jgi:type IV pilus assembly protein PilW
VRTNLTPESWGAHNMRRKLNFAASPTSPLPCSIHLGFSIIEIMVGLAIGLLVTLVIVQVMSTFEGQKRSTSGTADAQTNGGIALFNLQREVGLGGYGLPVFDLSNSPMRCTAPEPAGTDLSPVTIIDGGTAAGASDSIIVRYGGSEMGGVPVRVLLATPAGGTSVNLGVLNNMGCRVGDAAIVTSGGVCRLTSISGPTDIGVPPVVSAPPDTTHIVIDDGTGVSAGASVACMGRWDTVNYAVTANELTRNGASMVTGIVNIQAQYGVAATADVNKISEWVNATGAIWGTTMTSANRNRIKAIRVAIVARNGLLEKTDVTAACSSTAMANPTGLCAWDATSANPAIASPAPTVNISNDANWRKYRYRVFEAIIPLRNVIWPRQAL